MTLNSYIKFVEEPTCCWKNGMRNLVKFNVSTRKSQNLHFDGILTSKGYKVLAKKLQRSYVSFH